MAGLLIAALNVPDREVRLRVTRALIELGAPAVPALVKALGDEDPLIWRLASAALAKIGVPAVEALVAAVEGDDEQTRLLAAALLVRMRAITPASPAWGPVMYEYHRLTSADGQRLLGIQAEQS